MGAPGSRVQRTRPTRPGRTAWRSPADTSRCTWGPPRAGCSRIPSTRRPRAHTTPTARTRTSLHATQQQGKAWTNSGENRRINSRVNWGRTVLAARVHLQEHVKLWGRSAWCREVLVKLERELAAVHRLHTAQARHRSCAHLKGTSRRYTVRIKWR